jgi:hypothetical protein
MTDLFRKYKSLFSTTSNSFGTGSDVDITLNSATGLPTDTDITLTFDRVDSNGSATGLMERIIGRVSGVTFAVKERGVDNTTERAHTTPVVEQVFNAADWNGLMEALLVNYQQDGKFIDIEWYDLTYASEVSVDGDNGSKQRITLTGNVEFTFDNIPDARVFVLRITQDESGGHSVTFPTTGITWLTPTTDVDTTADKSTVYGFIQTGEDTYDGYLMGKEY